MNLGDRYVAFHIARATSSAWIGCAVLLVCVTRLDPEPGWALRLAAGLDIVGLLAVGVGPAWALADLRRSGDLQAYGLMKRRPACTCLLALPVAAVSVLVQALTFRSLGHSAEAASGPIWLAEELEASARALSVVMTWGLAGAVPLVSTWIGSSVRRDVLSISGRGLALGIGAWVAREGAWLVTARGLSNPLASLVVFGGLWGVWAVAVRRWSAGPSSFLT
ncbi:MAG: hypothetical protein ACFB9M_15410 [Myxococcota bacterium]